MQVPVPDMANLANNTIWPDVENRLVDLIESHNSTIVFANSRRLAERLTARLNEIHAERSGMELTTDANPKVAGGAPAHIMGSGQTYGADPILARAHHGSVSKEQRALVEEDLKRGLLKAVVATSSLELGIDMGAVDLVIQVEAPPSVASGLQRIGRAGHQVGEVSQGVLFPKHRTDLIGCAVSVQRMLTGQIETMRVPANPLDILAQHTVAAAALEPLDADRWFDTVRRSAPFATLPRSAFEATLDLLSGKYPSTEFAELRPRLVYDRDTGTVTARPGRAAARGDVRRRHPRPRAVHRLPGHRLRKAFAGRRTRRGDGLRVAARRCHRAGRHQLADHRDHPRPGAGDPGAGPAGPAAVLARRRLGPPRRAGRARSARSPASWPAWTREAFETRCAGLGFDEYATDNLWRLLDDQRSATGVVPTDTTLLVERFRDELGDWRVILHSPYGLRVHGPLALAVAGGCASATASTRNPPPPTTASWCGCPTRCPSPGPKPPPGADLFVFDADEIDPIVTAEVGGSALFASRFRECAARALLLPRRHPGRRSPLWHQRQRAAQLLDVARKYPDFPIVLETVRECLQDVYDVPTLARLMRDIAARGSASWRPRPRRRRRSRPRCCSATSGRSCTRATARWPSAAPPRCRWTHAAGRVAGPGRAARAARPRGRRRHRPAAAASGADRAARDAEAVADLLRLLGPLTAEEVAARAGGADVGGWLEGLYAAKRALPVSFAGAQLVGGDRGHRPAARRRRRRGAGRRAGQLHRGGRRPAGRAAGPLRAHPRARSPPPTSAARFGLGLRVAADVLGRLAADGRAGPRRVLHRGGRRQWCDADVLRILRRRSLAALRAQVEPVSTAAYARFLPAWQRVGPGSARQLRPGRSGRGHRPTRRRTAARPRRSSRWCWRRGCATTPRRCSTSCWPPARCIWSGAGLDLRRRRLDRVPPRRIRAADAGRPAEIEFTDDHRAILDTLAGGGAYFFRQLRRQRRRRSRAQDRTVGTDLGRLGHRRHVRTGARDAVGGAGTRKRSAPAHAGRGSARRG